MPSIDEREQREPFKVHGDQWCCAQCHALSDPDCHDRLTRYAEAVGLSDQTGWVDSHDALTVASAVMAVADAEQVELRGALDLAVRTIGRMLDGDANVARALDLPLPDDEALWPDYLADGLVETAAARMRALADERAKVARAWGEGHAAGRDYAGDGWNSDAHDPDEDNPYLAALDGPA